MVVVAPFLTHDVVYAAITQWWY